MINRIRTFGISVVVVAVGACTASITAEQGVGESRQWLCESGSGRVTCDAAIPGSPDESGAYACDTAGNDPALCPPEDALWGVREELEALGKWTEFAGQPWACLLTGAHERHCSKDVERRHRADEMVENGDPDGFGGAGDDGDAQNPGDDPGGFGDDAGLGDDVAVIEAPPLPADCSDAAWEEFFCGHATWSYQQNGVDIVFDCDVFDADGSFLDVALDLVAGADGLPSCFDGEWEMREGAWLAAVQAGCFDLNEEILVLCQQGANAAMEDAACNASGTW